MLLYEGESEKRHTVCKLLLPKCISNVKLTLFNFAQFYSEKKIVAARDLFEICMTR